MKQIILLLAADMHKNSLIDKQEMHEYVYLGQAHEQTRKPFIKNLQSYRYGMFVRVCTFFFKSCSFS